MHKPTDVIASPAQGCWIIRALPQTVWPCLQALSEQTGHSKTAAIIEKIEIAHAVRATLLRVQATSRLLLT